MNIMKKIKEGPTVTMFVPYDCNNSCPFCVNKEEYRNSSSFDLDRCYRSLDLLDRIFPHNDVVFTGGEPLAELEALEDIIAHVGETHNLYINTTLPTSENQDIHRIAEFLNRHQDMISCVNVSRHLKHYVKECSDEIFDLLKVRHRINCVIFEDAKEPSTKEKLIKFLDRFNGHEVQIRANYSNLTLENVFETEGDDLFDLLCDIAEYQYPLEKELFRTGFVFHYKDSLVTYHKTLPFSKIDGKVGDIIIRQSGLIYDDWNNYGSPMDINELTLI